MFFTVGEDTSGEEEESLGFGFFGCDLSFSEKAIEEYSQGKKCLLSSLRAKFEFFDFVGFLVQLTHQ